MARVYLLVVLALGCFATLLYSPISSILHHDAVRQFAGHRMHQAQTNVQAAVDGDYLLGVGRADVTGSVVEVNMMGYADLSQTGTGLRQRIYARAFIIGNPNDSSQRVVYLVLDTQSGDTAIRYGILQKLATLGSDYAVYNKDTVAVTGTHSHSGPGAWLNYLLPQITSLGFYKDNYQAIVDGAVLAIQRAHESLTPGRLSYGQTTVLDGNTNRSPYAYLANPQAERSQYEYDVDKTMTLLSFERASDGLPMGSLSWFAVHGTSLYQNNTLIAGDNKGVAAYLLEQSMQAQNPNFVGGFSQANVGDTSPNLLGPYCQDTGLPCRFNDSTCGGTTEQCHGRGPQFQTIDQGTKSCYQIGTTQFTAAKSLLNSTALQPIPASNISSFHVFQNMSGYQFISPFNQSKSVKTCSAALGYGFAGGTTDGPGSFDFTQGTNDTGDSPALSNPLWVIARDFIHTPSEEQRECQSPKPILLDVGDTSQPYEWAPNIVDIQVLRVGPLLMIISPGEATTMSGRRWRNAVGTSAAQTLGIENPLVVLGGPANTYGHYIATEEEYGVQRYEGASTLFGPHELEAYINLTLTYLPYLGDKAEVASLQPLAPGPDPPINVNNSLSFITPVIIDNPTIFKSFGAVTSSPDPSKTFQAGVDTVNSTFVGANPRNNFRLEGTFAAIEQYNSASGTWVQVRSDRDWFLVYHWTRTSTILGTSTVTIEWEIEPATPSGLYRMKYYGDAKGIDGKIRAFTGTSGTFQVGS